MDRSMTEEQEDKAKGGDIGIGDGDIAGTNVPPEQLGRGTPEGGPSEGRTGVTRTSAAPGETGGYGENFTADNPEGITGGYGTGGESPEQQKREG